MTIHVELSKTELAEAHQELEKLLTAESGAVISTTQAVFLWVPIGIALAHILDKYGGGPALWALASVIFLSIGSNFLVSRAKKRLYTHILKDSTARDVRFQFLEDHIETQTPHSTARSAWDFIKKAHRTEKFVFLFIDNSHAYIIPTRLSGADDVFELAKSKIDARAC